MSSRGTLEKLVEGTFRALLICSAVYFGAKYAPYVLRVADNVKEKIIPGSAHKTESAYVANDLRQIPDSLQYADPKLYNAILIDRYITRAQSYDFTTINRTPNENKRE